MKTELLAILPLLAAAAVFAGCGVEYKLHESIELTPDGGGIMHSEIDLVWHADKDGRPMDDNLVKYYDMDEEEFQGRVALEFIDAYEKGLYLTEYVFDRKNFKIRTTGYFEDFNRAKRYEPGNIICTGDEEIFDNFKTEMHFQKGEDGSYSLILAQFIGGAIPESCKEGESHVPEGIEQNISYENSAGVKYTITGFTPIKAAEGLEKNGQAASLELNLERLHRDREYNRKTREAAKLERMSVVFEEYSTHHISNIVTFEATLAEAKATCARKYAELIKEHPPEAYWPPERPDDDPKGGTGDGDGPDGENDSTPPGEDTETDEEPGKEDAG